MMTTEELKLKTKNVVSELLPNINSQQIDDDQDIFYLGLNSINAMTLIFNLQEAFGITFNDAEISLDNFRTISDIVKLIDQKTKA
ncbi:acyl carrier protein [Pleurocapsa sp. PCC 7319]|uniref:acyl carrier protein n=1 Tax=Pleurocapsa sp. PCC 7319 TaxID=118161 RepID=UPI001181BB1C|nr:acyl carrier protein [Pleurocapsa sp. PCC 7319]